MQVRQAALGILVALVMTAVGTGTSGATTVGSPSLPAFAQLEAVVSASPDVAALAAGIASIAARPEVRSVIAGPSDPGTIPGTPVGSDASAVRDQYLQGLIALIQTPVPLPLTGLQGLDDDVTAFNSFTAYEQSAGARELIVTFLATDTVRAYVLDHVEALLAAGTNPADLFNAAMPDLSRLVWVMPAGLGNIIGAIAGVAAGAAGIACVIAEPCGAALGIAVGALTIVSGGGFLVDELTSNTASAAGCVVNASLYMNYTSDYAQVVATAKCPQTQYSLRVDANLYRNGTVNAAYGGSCSQASSCSESVATQGSAGTCWFGEGTFLASNGTPSNGRDYSGSACFAR